MKTKVGTDGFVELIDVMGNDQAIVDAARISYGLHRRAWSDKDRHLIRYLMRHRHTTPFEMVEFKFLVRCPMDTWRQWIRHRTANVNEYSTRYKDAIDSVAKSGGVWRAQSSSSKQGSSGLVDQWPDDWPVDAGYRYNPDGMIVTDAECSVTDYLTQQEEHLHTVSRKVYQTRLQLGVAREQARKDLPLSTYTEAYWKIDLHNLFHFLGLRMASDAQAEIQEFANAMFPMAEGYCPVACEAFSDYRLRGVWLTGCELDNPSNLSGRERDEFNAKVDNLGGLLEFLR